MKHLSALLFTATALAVVGASTAVAQRPAGERDYVFTPNERQDGPDSKVHDEAKTGAKTPATVPLPEAKRNYQEKERQLRDLAEGKTDVLRLDVERITDQRLAPLGQVFVDQRKLDQVRQAVTEAYDARQQLQAAELAELERRIASIKRAMALREAMKESIIDQRTEELIEQIEAAENSPKENARRKATSTPTSRGATPAYPGATVEKRSQGADPFSADGPQVGPEVRRRLLELDVREAETKLAAAERDYKRGKALHDTGAIGADVFNQLSDELERAKIQCERAKVKLKALSAPPSADTKPAKSPTEEVTVEVPVVVNGRLEKRIRRVTITKNPEEDKPLEAKPDSGASGKSTKDAGESAARKPGPKSGEPGKPNDGESETADGKNALTITLIDTEGKPAAVYLADGKVGEPLLGTPEEQDDQIRQAVVQGVSAGKPNVVIKAEKGVAHRDVLRVSAAAGSIEGVSLHLAVAKDGIDGEHKNAP